MNKLKKVVAALIATATVASLGVSAFAVDYNNVPFSFNLGKNDSAYSGTAVKQDNLNYAKANCQDGNVDSTAYIWLSVCRYYHGSRVSEYKKADVLKNYTIYYTTECNEGSYFQLYGETDSYGAYVTGKWDP